MFKKSIAIVILNVFCITQVSWAAPAMNRAQNLRKDSDTLTQASGVGEALLKTSDAAATGLEGALAEKEGFSIFSEYFRNSLQAVSDKPEALVEHFENAIMQEAQRRHGSQADVRQMVLEKLRYLAQDPGTPFNQPPESWYLIANFLYLKLQADAITELGENRGMGEALQSRLNFVL